MKDEEKQEILARARYAAEHLNEHPEILERIYNGVISGMEQVNLTRELCGITQEYFGGEVSSFEMFYKSFLRNE